MHSLFWSIKALRTLFDILNRRIWLVKPYLNAHSTWWGGARWPRSPQGTLDIATFSLVIIGVISHLRHITSSTFHPRIVAHFLYIGKTRVRSTYSQSRSYSNTTWWTFRQMAEIPFGPNETITVCVEPCTSLGNGDRFYLLIARTVVACWLKLECILIIQSSLSFTLKSIF